ncbi:MAG: histidinol-phosphate transaminase [Opitutales bacterium]|nr:histidinol-phosphate transaminase [Opitutales bacterium]
MKENPAQYALPHIQALAAYTPGKQPDTADWIKLNTNELTYPPSPRVAQAITAELHCLERYPSPISAALRSTIAKRHGLLPSQVIVGNGSDDVLNLLMRAFCGQNMSAGMLLPSYSLYPVLAAIQGQQISYIPFTSEMRLPVDACASSKANIFFLTAPNAPTGVFFPMEEIAAVASRINGILVIDEAYAEFAPSDCVPLLHKYRNVVITRTCSKTQGLAGLRVGWGMGDPDVIEILDRVRDSYNVNRLSQAGAKAALEDVAYYSDIIARIRTTRDSFAREVAQRGFYSYPSVANFILTRPTTRSGQYGPEQAQSLFDAFYERRILVRYLPGTALTDAFLRISIGTPEQMNTLLEVIDQWQTRA